MQTPPVPRRATRPDGNPAYVNAPPFVRQSDIDRYGSYAAARKALGEGQG